jgi:hypothetical protein
MTSDTEILVYFQQHFKETLFPISAQMLKLLPLQQNASLNIPST